MFLLLKIVADLDDDTSFGKQLLSFQLYFLTSVLSLEKCLLYILPKQTENPTGQDSCAVLLPEVKD